MADTRLVRSHSIRFRTSGNFTARCRRPTVAGDTPNVTALASDKTLDLGLKVFGRKLDVEGITQV